MLRPRSDDVSRRHTRHLFVAFIRLCTRILQHLVGGGVAATYRYIYRLYAYLSLHLRGYAACARLIAHLQARAACVSLVFVEVTGSSTGASDSLAAWEKLQRIREESEGGSFVLVSQPVKVVRVSVAFCVF